MDYRGYLSDGLTSARRPVRIFPDSRALHLYGEEGGLLDEWPYEGLRLAEEVYGDHPFRLRHKEKGEAILVSTSPELLPVLERRIGRRLRERWLFRPSFVMAVLWVLALTGIVTGSIWGLPLLVPPMARLVPPSWEQALGEKVARQIAAGGSYCQGRQGMQALEGLTARLTMESREKEALPYPLRIHVSGNPMVNAFAAPGGQVVLMRGLIEAAKTPEEVAGVLAHEIAHSLERHPMQGLIRAAGIGLLFGALTGDTSTLDSLASQFGQMMVVFSYTRSDELTADRIGVGLLNRAGIRGRGLVDFFRRMRVKAAGQPKLPAFLSTHPLTDQRIALIEAEARGEGEAMNAQEWQALRAICG